MTQSEVAEISGINEKYLGRIERNESVPTVDKVEQICRAFDIRVSDMLTPITVYHFSDDKQDTVQKRITTSIYYCNCCGEEFSTSSNTVICPNCLCPYDEDNNNIEKYNVSGL